MTVIKNGDETITCIPPWNIYEFMDATGMIIIGMPDGSLDITFSTEQGGLDDKCPECGTQLTPLYTYNSYVSMDFFGSEGQHTLYGYWCEGCQKMHPKEQEP